MTNATINMNRILISFIILLTASFMQAQKAKNITKIILFGSSIEKRCTENSDIDIAVFGSLQKSKYIDSKEFRAFKSGLFSFDWDQDYDVLYFRDNTEYQDAIMDDINNGVEIYRRAAE